MLSVVIMIRVPVPNTRRTMIAMIVPFLKSIRGSSANRVEPLSCYTNLVAAGKNEWGETNTISRGEEIVLRMQSDVRGGANKLEKKLNGFGHIQE